MTRRRAVIATLALVGVAITAGCSPDSGDERSNLPPTASEIFAGLDRPLVEEVLANPNASRKIAEEETESARHSMAQGIVINFWTCRWVAGAYREWVTQGRRPDVPPVPRVGAPQEPSYGDALVIRDSLAARVASGDPSALREYLTGPSSCGHWIPAEPGDVSGPTIEDSLEDLR